MLQRYFFSIRLCTLRLQGSSPGELGPEVGGEGGGDSNIGKLESKAGLISGRVGLTSISGRGKKAD